MTPTPQGVRRKDNKIVKLPTVRSCFTSAMTNKLVVIINSLNVPKIKKILLYEMKFLVRNNSCLQNPWVGGYRPQIPVLFVLNWICWTPPPSEQNSWVRHCIIWTNSTTLVWVLWHPQFSRTEILIYFKTSAFYTRLFDIESLRKAWRKSKHVQSSREL
jgi:hypothetical protein